MYILLQKAWCSYTNVSDQREHLLWLGPQSSTWCLQKYGSRGSTQWDFSKLQPPKVYAKTKGFNSHQFIFSLVGLFENPPVARPRSPAVWWQPAAFGSAVQLPAPAEDRRPFLVNLGSPLQLYWPTSRSPQFSSLCWKSTVYLGIFYFYFLKALKKM